MKREVAASETPHARPLVVWCLSTDPDGVSGGMNNVTGKHVAGRGNCDCESYEQGA